MKIAYVNGFRGECSTKADTLRSMFPNMTIDHVIYYHDDMEKTKENLETLKNYDLVIASSTGALLVRPICHKYNIPLISLNPVIDAKETFDKLGYQAPEVPFLDERLTEMVLLTEDDELIDPKKTKELLRSKNIMFKTYKTGGHTFENLKVIEPDVREFMALTLLKPRDES